MRVIKSFGSDVLIGARKYESLVASGECRFSSNNDFVRTFLQPVDDVANDHFSHDSLFNLNKSKNGPLRTACRFVSRILNEC